jgi:Ca2+-binding EF-hand superfamily protein
MIELRKDLKAAMKEI